MGLTDRAKKLAELRFLTQDMGLTLREVGIKLEAAGCTEPPVQIGTIINDVQRVSTYVAHELVNERGWAEKK